MGRYKESAETARGKGKHHGSHWITDVRRVAIYLRDGMACAYCGATVEDGTTILSLDHIIPHSKGGNNSESNLISSCKRCNSSRGNRDLDTFTCVVSEYTNRGITALQLFTYINDQIRMDLAPYITEAKTIIARRGENK